jgi:hypothetical protein
MFSLANRPEPPTVEVDVEVPKSAYYLRLKSQSNVAFLGICFGVGVVATNVIRLFPEYYVFYALLSVSGIIALLAFPSADLGAKYLWRWGAIALLGGLALPWWEILHLIPKWVWIGLFLAIVGIVVAIGGNH